MRKFGWLLILLTAVFSATAYAQSMITVERQGRKKSTVTAVSFPDFPPLSEIRLKNRSYELYTVFNDGMELFAKTNNYRFKFSIVDDYETVVENVRRGKADILLGMYYDTELYEGLEYIYPAILNNPVHVAMLPSNIGKISKVEDLKAMKGIYIAEDYFSDYVLKNFKSLGIQPVFGAEEAYRRLFVGEADYVAGSYYFNYAAVVKMGLRDYVAFSKAPLWNMPMFLGLSKVSKFYKKLDARLKKFIAAPKFKESIENSLKETMRRIEEESQGVVPPKFVRESLSGELTPADEKAQSQE